MGQLQDILYHNYYTNHMEKFEDTSWKFSGSEKHLIEFERPFFHLFCSKLFIILTLSPVETCFHKAIFEFIWCFYIRRQYKVWAFCFVFSGSKVAYTGGRVKKVRQKLYPPIYIAAGHGCPTIPTCTLKTLR